MNNNQFYVRIKETSRFEMEMRESKLRKINGGGPQGVSGVAVLAESHISIHTWPEKSYAALDIFVCGENADPDLALNHIKTRFEATTLNTRRLKRGIPKLSSSTEL